MFVLRPLVSVILPIRNEAPFIAETLRAVLAQDYPRELLEVIVVDGMSEDGTRPIVQRLAETDPRLRLLDNSRRITPAALNIGIRAARGEVIVRVDGHGVIPPNYVRECVAVLTDTVRDRSPSEPGDSASPSPTASPPSPLSTFQPVSVSALPCDLLAVGGAWDCAGRGIVRTAIALATSSKFGVGGSRYRTTRPWANPRTPVRGYAREPVQTDTVPFWAMRRAVFEQIGLFHEEMLCHEDYEFNHRLRQAGGTILLLPWLRSKYYVRSTLRAVCRQYGRYGFWKGRFLRSHPESLKTRHLIPPLFVAALFVAAAAASVGGAGQVALGILIAAYLCFLAVATATLLVTRTREHEFADLPPSDIRPLPSDLRPPRPASPPAPCSLLLAPLLPLVLATLHLSWGVGVWFGLLRGKVPGEPPKL